MEALNNPKIILEMVDALPNMKDRNEETTKEFNKYFEVLKDGRFEENEGEDEAIKRTETIFHKLDGMVERRKLVLENGIENFELIGLEERKMNDLIKQLEEWTQMKIGNIVFDSDVDNWNVATSVFDERILNKSNLIFLIEDDNDNLFGGYINPEIDGYGYEIPDPNSFVFSLKSNGRLNGMMKFNIIKSDCAFVLYSPNNTWLFGIGNSGFDGSQDDITIMKQYCEGSDQFSGCNQTVYNYDGIEYALCGKQSFTPKRITVIQVD